MVLTDSSEVDRKLRRLRFYGMEGRYSADEHGYNCRLDELQAEILRRKLRRLDGYLARRREIAARYREALADSELVLPTARDDAFHAYYLFVVRHPRRDDIIARLAERQIFVNVSYPWPIHTMKGYAQLGYRAGDLPHTEKAAEEIFSLPMYPMLQDAEVDRVCAALREIVG
jgi:aminotransferase EvaB